MEDESMTTDLQMLRPWHRMAPLMALILLAACGQSDLGGRVVGGSTVQMSEGVRPTRGFLPQPDLLQAGGSGQPALVYREPAAQFSSYTKVILDPVVIRAAPNSELRDASMSQRQALAADFYSDLKKALAKNCNMTEMPGPGTLRLSFALVDGTNPNAAVATVATYTPYLSTAQSLASMAFNNGVGYFAGTATAEGFATDATTGRLLWQAVGKRGGTNAVVKDTLSSWVDVNNAFDAWSAQLASGLQRLGVCRA
jgi:hypothetical protein